MAYSDWPIIGKGVGRKEKKKAFLEAFFFFFFFFLRNINYNSKTLRLIAIKFGQLNQFPTNPFWGIYNSMRASSAGLLKVLASTFYSALSLLKAI